MITGYLQETNREMIKRQRKGLPAPSYSYIAVRTKPATKGEKSAAYLKFKRNQEQLKRDKP